MTSAAVLPAAALRVDATGATLLRQVGLASGVFVADDATARQIGHPVPWAPPPRTGRERRVGGRRPPTPPAPAVHGDAARPLVLGGSLDGALTKLGVQLEAFELPPCARTFREQLAAGLAWAHAQIQDGHPVLLRMSATAPTPVSPSRGRPQKSAGNTGTALNAEATPICWLLVGSEYDLRSNTTTFTLHTSFEGTASTRTATSLRLPSLHRVASLSDRGGGRGGDGSVVRVSVPRDVPLTLRAVTGYTRCFVDKDDTAGDKVASPLQRIQCCMVRHKKKKRGISNKERKRQQQKQRQRRRHRPSSKRSRVGRSPAIDNENGGGSGGGGGDDDDDDDDEHVEWETLLSVTVSLNSTAQLLKPHTCYLFDRPEHVPNAAVDFWGCSCVASWDFVPQCADLTWHTTSEIPASGVAIFRCIETPVDPQIRQHKVSAHLRRKAQRWLAGKPARSPAQRRKSSPGSPASSATRQQHQGKVKKAKARGGGQRLSMAAAAAARRREKGDKARAQIAAMNKTSKQKDRARRNAGVGAAEGTQWGAGGSAGSPTPGSLPSSPKPTLRRTRTLPDSRGPSKPRRAPEYLPRLYEVEALPTFMQPAELAYAKQTTDGAGKHTTTTGQGQGLFINERHDHLRLRRRGGIGGIGDGSIIRVFVHMGGEVVGGSDDTVFVVNCGSGQQTVKWLALTAAERYRRERFGGAGARALPGHIVGTKATTSGGGGAATAGASKKAATKQPAAATKSTRTSPPEPPAGAVQVDTWEVALTDAPRHRTQTTGHRHSDPAISVKDRQPRRFVRTNRAAPEAGGEWIGDRPGNVGERAFTPEKGAEHRARQNQRFEDKAVAAAHSRFKVVQMMNKNRARGADGGGGGGAVGGFKSKMLRKAKRKLLRTLEGDDAHSGGKQTTAPKNKNTNKTRKERKMKQKTSQAAQRIQAAHRGRQGRRRVNSMTRAACKMQAIFRGGKTRKRLIKKGVPTSTDSSATANNGRDVFAAIAERRKKRRKQRIIDSVQSKESTPSKAETPTARGLGTNPNPFEKIALLLQDEAHVWIQLHDTGNGSSAVPVVSGFMDKAFFGGKHAKRGAMLKRAGQSVAGQQAAYWAEKMAKKHVNQADSLLKSVDEVTQRLAPDLLHQCAQMVRKFSPRLQVFFTRFLKLIHVPREDNDNGMDDDDDDDGDSNSDDGTDFADSMQSRRGRKDRKRARLSRGDCVTALDLVGPNSHQEVEKWAQLQAQGADGLLQWQGTVEKAFVFVLNAMQIASELLMLSRGGKGSPDAHAAGGLLPPLGELLGSPDFNVLDLLSDSKRLHDAMHAICSADWLSSSSSSSSSSEARAFGVAVQVERLTEDMVDARSRSLRRGRRMAKWADAAAKVLGNRFGRLSRDLAARLAAEKEARLAMTEFDRLWAAARVDKVMWEVVGREAEDDAVADAEEQARREWDAAARAAEAAETSSTATVHDGAKAKNSSKNKPRRRKTKSEIDEDRMARAAAATAAGRLARRRVQQGARDAYRRVTAAARRTFTHQKNVFQYYAVIGGGIFDVSFSELMLFLKHAGAYVEGDGDGGGASDLRVGNVTEIFGMTQRSGATMAVADAMAAAPVTSKRPPGPNKGHAAGGGSTAQGKDPDGGTDRHNDDDDGDDGDDADAAEAVRAMAAEEADREAVSAAVTAARAAAVSSGAATGSEIDLVGWLQVHVRLALAAYGDDEEFGCPGWAKCYTQYVQDHLVPEGQHVVSDEASMKVALRSPEVVATMERHAAVLEDVFMRFSNDEGELDLLGFVKMVSKAGLIDADLTRLECRRSFVRSQIAAVHELEEQGYDVEPVDEASATDRSMDFNEFMHSLPRLGQDKWDSGPDGEAPIYIKQDRISCALATLDPLTPSERKKKERKQRQYRDKQ